MTDNTLFIRNVGKWLYHHYYPSAYRYQFHYYTLTSVRKVMMKKYYNAFDVVETEYCMNMRHDTWDYPIYRDELVKERSRVYTKGR